MYGKIVPSFSLTIKLGAMVKYTAPTAKATFN